ncbi:hypothetical protein [Priestia megaterium]|uniref:hypothetical protein n=1 Tax=Priestia megaterium TaxID=1404 RepID=UPI00366CEF8A
MDYWRNNTIWFEQIPEEVVAYLNLNEQKFNKLTFQDIKYLTLWHHKSKLGNLIDIPILEDLLYLELVWSNIQNLTGIEKLSKIKRLELSYCTKLKKDQGLENLSDTLEHLHINHSKKFVPSKNLFALKNLRVLCLNSCGSLEDLSFLSHFPKLIDFRFVDTNVLSGDLTPILEHPTIRSVSYMNKRHYNIKSEKMYSLLNDKNDGEEYQSIVKNGKLETFRYIY